ncbi:hypothetical protein N9L48_06170 [Psychrosphaera sp.]|nr:hypothetical protein [Psychrosphaera sp.]
MNKTCIYIPPDVLDSAKTYLESKPSTPEEVVMHWIRLGKAIDGELSDSQAMNLQLGNLKICLVPKD